eukprot:3292088-Pyramimonas_sp.AAC.1
MAVVRTLVRAEKKKKQRRRRKSGSPACSRPSRGHPPERTSPPPSPAAASPQGVWTRLSVHRGCGQGCQSTGGVDTDVGSDTMWG